MIYAQKRELEFRQNRLAGRIANAKRLVAFVIVFVTFALMLGNTIDDRMTTRCEANGGSAEACRG